MTWQFIPWSFCFPHYSQHDKVKNRSAVHCTQEHNLLQYSYRRGYMVNRAGLDPNCMKFKVKNRSAVHRTQEHNLLQYSYRRGYMVNRAGLDPNCIRFKLIYYSWPTLVVLLARGQRLLQWRMKGWRERVKTGTIEGIRVQGMKREARTEGRKEGRQAARNWEGQTEEIRKKQLTCSDMVYWHQQCLECHIWCTGRTHP